MTNRTIGLLLINGPLPPPFGGVATYLAHTLPFLANRGFEIHSVIDRKPVNPAQYLQFEEAGIHLHYGGGARLEKIARIIRYTPLWISTLKKSGINPVLFFKSLKSIVSWIDATEHVLKNHNIDIIHAYDYPWVQGFVAVHLAKKYNKKFVQTTFGEVVPHKEELVHHDAFGDRYKHFVKYVLNQADLIISLSQHCASETEFVGVSKKNVRVTYWGVDTKHFRPELDGSSVRRQYGLGDSPIVLFIGQVRLRKGPQVLIEAAPEIIQQHPNVKFLIVGPDYGIVNQLKGRSRELKISDAVVFVGGKSHTELPAFYAACNIFVFPTCTPIECLGLSMIQAMACGKTVVGSRVNGIPEVIVDGETGFLVQPANPAELASKVSLLLHDENLRKNMEKAARRRVEEHFDQDKLVLDLEKLYLEVVHNA